MALGNIPYWAKITAVSSPAPETLVCTIEVRGDLGGLRATYPEISIAIPDQQHTAQYVSEALRDCITRTLAEDTNHNALAYVQALMVQFTNTDWRKVQV